MSWAFLRGGMPAVAADWPQWRGPEQNGVSNEKGLPWEWSEEKGIRWKCDLPVWGDSTPCIWRDAIFLTSQTDDGKLLLLMIGKQSGTVEWTRQVGTAQTPRVPLAVKNGEARRHQKFHDTHNMASPSPMTDGQLVVCHFGNGDLAVYDFAGNQLWHRNLQQDHGEYTIWWGHANSPVIVGDLVISVCMQDSCTDLPGAPSPSYLVAHDKRTGQVRWHTPRPTTVTAESCDSYITPLVWQRSGQTELVLMGGQMLDAYNPADGRRIWWFDGLIGNRVITGPVIAGGTIYATQGMRQPLLAFRPTGAGQRPAEEIVWKYAANTPDSGSPVVSGGSVYLVSDNGIAQCLDAASGELRWKERLKGGYRASPLAADGRIYFLNMTGLATVVRDAPQFERLAENQLDDATIASPAVSDGCLFLRGKQRLYCLAGAAR